MRELTIHACCEGKVINLEEVADDMFSQRILGDGFAIEPSSKQINAPINGVVTMIASTKHAFGIKTEDGFELLIHIGIDTVSLNGAGFTYHIQENTSVNQGDAIVTVDVERIMNANLSPVVIYVYVNRDIKILENKVTCGNVSNNDQVCEVIYS